MPLHKGKYLEPDEAVAAGLCPECGSEIDGESAQAHMAAHYSTVAHGREPNLEANRRAELVRAHYDKPVEEN